MRTILLSTTMALAVSAMPALAADMPVKAKPVAPVAESPFDIAFGSALMTDYNFRGITQSNHRPSVAAYFEPRYNVNKDLQFYVGTSGESIDFPNHAAAEIDFYGGVRPTFDKLALDFGVWYYWYPGGECFNGDTTTPCAPPGATTFTVPGGLALPNGNAVKGNLSFVEIYGKATYTINDQ